MPKAYKIYIALAIIPQLIIINILKNHHSLVEDYYSNLFYPISSKALRFSFGIIPFSVGDLFYVIGGILIIRWVFLNIKRIITDTKCFIIDIVAFTSILYATFHVFWALNYYRTPLHEQLSLKSDYTTEELTNVVKYLVKKSNNYHNSLAPNDSTKVSTNLSKTEIMEQVPLGYDALSEEYPNFKYSVSSVKSSLLKKVLSYMGFSGYLNPFTNEAQVNTLIPKVKIVTTSLHEIAHQLGYSAENEANFLASLSATHHPDAYYKYSGYIFTLRHCLHELYKRNPEAYHATIPTINKGILKNYKEARLFWDSYQNISEPVFKKTYNAYLKANNQKKGIDSYNYMVALAVNYYSTKI